jgi:hypothetical protein
MSEEEEDYLDYLLGDENEQIQTNFSLCTGKSGYTCMHDE